MMCSACSRSVSLSMEKTWRCFFGDDLSLLGKQPLACGSEAHEDLAAVRLRRLAPDDAFALKRGEHASRCGGGDSSGESDVTNGHLRVTFKAGDELVLREGESSRSRVAGGPAAGSPDRLEELVPRGGEARDVGGVFGCELLRRHPSKVANR